MWRRWVKKKKRGDDSIFGETIETIFFFFRTIWPLNIDLLQKFFGELSDH